MTFVAEEKKVQRQEEAPEINVRLEEALPYVCECGRFHCLLRVVTVLGRGLSP